MGHEMQAASPEFAYRRSHRWMIGLLFAFIILSCLAMLAFFVMSYRGDYFLVGIVAFIAMLLFLVAGLRDTLRGAERIIVSN